MGTARNDPSSSKGLHMVGCCVPNNVRMGVRMMLPSGTDRRMRDQKRYSVASIIQNVSHGPGDRYSFEMTRTSDKIKTQGVVKTERW